MFTAETLKAYLTKLSTERLEKLYLQIYFMLEERDIKSGRKKVPTAKVDTKP